MTDKPYGYDHASARAWSVVAPDRAGRIRRSQDLEDTPDLPLLPGQAGPEGVVVRAAPEHVASRRFPIPDRATCRAPFSGAGRAGGVSRTGAGEEARPPRPRPAAAVLRHPGDVLLDVRGTGPADGEPLVLLHGFPQDGTSWDRALPDLHAAGLRTLVPDQRGYAAGARPRGRSDYRLELLVGDVLALLDAAGLSRAHVAGHDWGGIVAWALASAHPDRVATLTVASTPHPGALGRSLFSSPQALRSAYVGLFQLPRLPEALLGPRLEALLRRSGLPAEDARRYAARMREPGALTGALNWYRALPLSRLRTGPVGVPTTYAWGRRDGALGRRAAELTAEHVVGPYRFEELAAGHWLPETRPQDLARLIAERTAGDPAA